jgi:hypothetical protein
MKNISISIVVVGPVFLLAVAGAVDTSFLGTLSHARFVASTIPSKGDLNPYGVAVVPVTQGVLEKGNVLVSNFNNSANFQGTGTTIVQISPNGTQNVFAQISADSLTPPCPGGVGLTTALVALSSGFVIVGSLPTTDGTAATAGAGCLANHAVHPDGRESGAGADHHDSQQLRRKDRSGRAGDRADGIGSFR